MTWLRILAVGVFVWIYLRSPIDLIPDRIGPIGLLDDLVVLLAFLAWARRQLGGVTPQRPHPEARAARTNGWNPYRILGVEPGAAPGEIAHAYRDQMKRYHPDRVADLGEELQQLAHQKAVEIQRAYEELTKA
ncbi:MAG TPA: DnaJ domain-containing protein [Candidatus Binatia bacterium]|nr:DnaJ domain-containing protein [Candidatus Binatia bacterium]